MSTSLAAQLFLHDQYRAVPCLFCRNYWEERLVGVRLHQDPDILGSLCPRCLSYSPRQNAVWLSHFGEALRKSVAEFVATSKRTTEIPNTAEQCQKAILDVVQSTTQIQAMTALLRQGTRDLKNQTVRTRRALEQMRGQSLSHDDATSSNDPELGHTLRLLALGPELVRLPAWQTTVTDLMHSEREAIIKKFGHAEQQVILAVERRYQQFMLRGA